MMREKRCDYQWSFVCVLSSSVKKRSIIFLCLAGESTYLWPGFWDIVTYNWQKNLRFFSFSIVYLFNLLHLFYGRKYTIDRFTCGSFFLLYWVKRKKFFAIHGMKATIVHLSVPVWNVGWLTFALSSAVSLLVVF